MAVGTYVVYPQLVVSALPYSLVAVCSLSMLLMMGGMNDKGSQSCKSGQPLPHAGKNKYVCPMHPDVRTSEPGRCSICGVALVPTESPQTKEPPLMREERLAQLQAQLQRLGDQHDALAREVQQLQEESENDLATWRVK